MYSTDQLSGILLLTASCKFNIVRVRSNRGWEPRFLVYIRPPEKMIQALCDTLEAEGISFSLIRERGRRVDTILIRRRHSIFRVCEIFPSFVPSKNSGWETFKILMGMIQENKHLEEDGKYNFEVVMNEDEEKTKDLHRQMGDRKDLQD